jgi:hypothetical protein
LPKLFSPLSPSALMPIVPVTFQAHLHLSLVTSAYDDHTFQKQIHYILWGTHLHVEYRSLLFFKFRTRKLTVWCNCNAFYLYSGGGEFEYCLGCQLSLQGFHGFPPVPPGNAGMIHQMGHDCHFLLNPFIFIIHCNA